MTPRKLDIILVHSLLALVPFLTIRHFSWYIVILPTICFIFNMWCMRERLKLLKSTQEMERAIWKNEGKNEVYKYLNYIRGGMKYDSNSTGVVNL